MKNHPLERFPMKISVIVPAYNCEKTLALCLKAVCHSVYNDFELIVVDDGCTDRTREIAKQYTNNIVVHPKRTNPFEARLSGANASNGDVFAFVDSDVVISPGTLENIGSYFSANKDIRALTGLLSKEHPSHRFFSQYKNLYMNHIFNQLPDRVTFLYGSIFALRKTLLKELDFKYEGAEDTALGQFLHRRGEPIAFLRNLQVLHLKEYGFLSWIRNDFRTSYLWARLFLKYGGWKQLKKGKAGFAHSPKTQIASIGLVFLTLVSLPVAIYVPAFFVLDLFPLSLWFLFNMAFFSFLKSEKGAFFATIGVVCTFIDHIVMGLGIVTGFFSALFLPLNS